jgi:hypothetical protein
MFNRMKILLGERINSSVYAIERVKTFSKINDNIKLTLLHLVTQYFLLGLGGGLYSNIHIRGEIDPTEL